MLLSILIRNYTHTFGVSVSSNQVPTDVSNATLHMVFATVACSSINPSVLTHDISTIYTLC